MTKEEKPTPAQLEEEMEKWRRFAIATEMSMKPEDLESAAINSLRLSARKSVPGTAPDPRGVGAPETESKPPRTGNDSLVTIGVLAIFGVLIWLLSIALDNTGPGGNAGYFVLAGIALFGVGWWFWRKLEDLK
jgi:uncharacterized membrane protein